MVRRWMAVVVTVAVLMAACGGEEADRGAGGGPVGDRSDEKEGGTGVTGEGLPRETLIDRWALAGGDPDHIDPAAATTPGGIQVADLVYDSLTQFDTDDDLAPAVADDWESEDDDRRWTFTLRDDAQFSTGEEITPSTVKRSWERALVPGLGSRVADHLLPIEGAAAVRSGDADELAGVVADDETSTLTVNLTDPVATWPDVVSHTVFSPVPEAAQRATNAAEIAEWERGEMVGNGPYRMDGPWQRGGVIRLVENTEYAGDRLARVPAIELRISASVPEAFRAFTAGEADTGPIPPGEFAGATGRFNNATGPVFGLSYLAVGWDDEQLGGQANVAVRRAISLAIDRVRINRTVHEGSRQVATGLTPPGIPGVEDGLCRGLCERDAQRARELIGEWGRAEGMEPIRLQFPRRGDQARVAAIIGENLTEVGLAVETVPTSEEGYEAAMAEACSLCLVEQVWDAPTYRSGLRSLVASNSSDNLGGFSAEAVDRALAEAAAETDEDARAERYRSAERRVLDAMGVIPLTWPTNRVVYSDRVDGLNANGLGRLNYPEISLSG